MNYVKLVNDKVNTLLKYILLTTARTILEVLFGLNYIWYGIIVLFPDVVNSRLLEYLGGSVPNYIFSLFFLVLGTFTLVGVYKGIFWCRQLALLCSTFICLLYAGAALFQPRPAGGAGFLIILAVLASVSLWKMKLTRNDE
jgi:hypothetical protein